VFVHVLELCREAGLIRLGLVALDGTKIKANAALDANRTAATLDEQIAHMMAEAEATDAREDRQFASKCGDTVPRELARREDRLARLKACKEKLERRAAEAAARQQEKIEVRAADEQVTGKRKRGRKPKPPNRTVDPEAAANPSDPGSEIMKTRKGWVQGYNAQAVVTADQIILAADVTTEANDVHQLTGMLDQAQAIVAVVMGEDAVLGTAVADAGYWSSPPRKTTSSAPSCAMPRAAGCRKTSRRASAWIASCGPNAAVPFTASAARRSSPCSGR